MSRSFTVRIPLVMLASAFATASLSGNDELEAELSLSPHKIVFESYVDDNWELCVMNADGSGRRNLTNTPEIHELYPQASPNGKRICFLADVQHDDQTVRSVYYMNSDGTDRTLVAHDARQPCWHPDGKQIAYLPQEFERFNIADYVSQGLRIYDLGSGGTDSHPNESIHHLYALNWCRDGQWFVATVHGGMGYGHANLALRAEGDTVHDLKIPGCRPCLSPDGSRVTWSLDDHTIMAADLVWDAAEPTVSNQVTIDKRETLHLYHPDFSPDGNYITYSVGPGGRVQATGPGTHTQLCEMVGVRGKWNIFLMRASGEGEPLQLSDDEDLSNKESEWVRGAATSGTGGE